MFDTVFLEIKAKEGGIAEEDYAQAINYLKVSGCKIGLILNFARLKLEIKRVGKIKYFHCHPEKIPKQKPSILPVCQL